jgi:hypothetical protein
MEGKALSAQLVSRPVTGVDTEGLGPLPMTPAAGTCSGGGGAAISTSGGVSPVPSPAAAGGGCPVAVLQRAVKDSIR